MVTKFLIVSLCITAGTMTGAVFSKRLKSRACYFDELLGLVNRIMAEVKFRKNTTKSILTEFCKECTSPLVGHLTEYLNCTDYSALKLSKSILTNDETEEVRKLLLSLGTSDSTTQLFELENSRLKVSQMLVTAEEKRKKLGGTYIKLGFFAGLTLGIIIL